jgi:dTDP-4-dehydrorhamnose 3,5-epimerase
MRKVHNQKMFKQFIDPKYQDIMYTQEYSKSKLIDGVQLVNVKNITGEDGNFSEILRINEKGGLELFPDFKLAQINRTSQMGNTIKAWHVHFYQDEIWYVAPNFHLFVGLWDLRKDSPTCGMTNRISLGANNSQLLYIPRGVAHGSAVISNSSVNLYYFINRQFDINSPDEQRIAWDHLGKEFWEPERD